MWTFWIDTGGTFTDCLARTPEGELRRLKTLSSSALRGRLGERLGERRLRIALTNPLRDGFYRGYRLAILEDGFAFESEIVGWSAEEGVATLADAAPELASGVLLEIRSPEEPPVLAARILTETPLDRALPPLEMRLATTRGTNALLERKGAKVAFFVTRGFGDLLRIGTQQRPDLFEIGIQKSEPLVGRVCEVDERLDARGEVLTPLDAARAREFVTEAVASGAESFAVALLHSYRNPAHEEQLAAILREAGARYVSLSAELAAFAKILPRAETTVVNAYLAPIMDAYLDSVYTGLGGGRLRVMTSAGGLTSRRQYRPKDSLLSGPAGGVVGFSAIGRAAGYERTIGFDMGGTSADVARFDGALDYRFEQRIGAARVFAPSLRIETVAAGGGSICWFDGSALRVGPQSAGASPGPACYGAGGPLAVTDVNLLLGRLDAARFGIPVSEAAARRRLGELRERVEGASGKRVSEDELLQGFLRIANERMAEAIRKISVGEGFDPSRYAMVAFGGAGGLHACAVADILRMDTVLFPADAGLLSAHGLQVARLEQFAARQVLRRLDACLNEIRGWQDELAEEAKRLLAEDGVPVVESEIGPTRFELRFLGQESILVVEGVAAGELQPAFEAAYAGQFGFLPQGLPVELVAMRVAARSAATTGAEERFDDAEPRTSETVFRDRAELVPGTALAGPVVIQDAFSTVFVDTGWTATVGSRGTLKLAKASEAAGGQERLAEVVELELFTNRYLAIVDEMGVLLERVAFSTNVRDRKDFSCALLDADGYLVANAPHIPVHLGALGVCLRTVLQTLSLNSGDVVVTNHPGFGGSHLPDVTLLAPVHAETGELLGYVANRAHHAELGGIAPGSMPPQARSLAEEGVVIPPLKLVEAGQARWERLEALLRGGQYPSRSPEENVADLAAQLASVRRGAAMLRELAAAEGVQRVRRFMGLLKQRAARALREALGRREKASAWAEESLDGGAKVCVTVERLEGERWRIDFSGPAGVQPDNYNATPAIVTSAAIYALRLLAGQNIPLNEGFLDVVELRIQTGMLNPDFPDDPANCPAVVAGNVEVSQLVVTTLLKAFGLAAASQTTMNNLIFGTPHFGYYETIAGGEGASPGRAGADAVHTHMTNTAMTDPELFELRYPAQLEALAIREGSGGAGARKGGEGVVKRIRFLNSVTLSLLSQRREQQPFGMAGGGPGAVGEQFLERADGRREALPGNGAWEVAAGEVFEIRTPGGGGWGRV